MSPTLSIETIRFHVPSMACEHDVDVLSKAIAAVESPAEVTFDRGMREIEISPVSAGAGAFREAIARAGYCVTR